VAAAKRTDVNAFFLLPFAAGFCSLVLAVISLVRRKPTVATWWFFAGMVALGLDSTFTGLSLRSAQLGDVVAWLTPAFVANSFVPVAWLGFSLTYSRRNYREFLSRWKFALALFALLPVAATLAAVTPIPGMPEGLWWLRPSPVTTALNAIFLIALVLILTNLEQTFRAAVGTMRWRIKFVVVAVAVVLGTQLYVRSQAILFSAPDVAFWSVEASALLIGCVFLGVAHLRTGLTEIDVYPSLAVLRSSFTVMIVGAYLFIVGVLAQIVSSVGGAEVFQFQAVVVIAGMAGLAVLLLSDRTRQKIHTFVVRHFSRAQHDSVRIWTLFSRRLATVTDQTILCATSAKLISETFDVLSVTVWLRDEEKDVLVLKASTSPHAAQSDGISPETASERVLAGLQGKAAPFDLEELTDQWGDELRQLNPTTFATGGNRWCVPLQAGDDCVGVVVLADRVNGAIYTLEELDLLKCIGDHLTSVLLNLRLAGEVSRSKELEAFRMVSAFFVHDLKNAAASLNLMLKNLPVHFDDPAFRADALRSIGNTAKRIDDMIARLSALRQRPDAMRVEADLNQLVTEALDKVNDLPNVELTKELHPLPPIVADREQIQSVVTNLVLNARDALGATGMIQVRTSAQGKRVLLSVIDNGCGMTPAFLKESLFRPFQSTKKKGLGIGLFQARAIVQAHGGGMHVESEVGKGTTFLVSLPAKDAQ
jgi:putative PEP-CTERM system histidine kinase